MGEGRGAGLDISRPAVTDGRRLVLSLVSECAAAEHSFDTNKNLNSL